MPGYSCNIKERMLYSSCKSRLLEEVEKDYHLEIAKKVLDGKLQMMIFASAAVPLYFMDLMSLS